MGGMIDVDTSRSAPCSKEDWGSDQDGMNRESWVNFAQSRKNLEGKKSTVVQLAKKKKWSKKEKE